MCKNLAFILLLPGVMVSKMADKVGVIFGKLEAFGDRIFKN